MACTINYLSTHIVLHEWVVDFGATYYVVVDECMFSHCHKIVNIKSDKVNLPTGDKVDISHIREA